MKPKLNSKFFNVLAYFSNGFQKTSSLKYVFVCKRGALYTLQHCHKVTFRCANQVFKIDMGNRCYFGERWPTLRVEYLLQFMFSVCKEVKLKVNLGPGYIIEAVKPLLIALIRNNVPVTFGFHCNEVKDILTNIISKFPEYTRYGIMCEMWTINSFIKQTDQKRLAKFPLQEVRVNLRHKNEKCGYLNGILQIPSKAIKLNVPVVQLADHVPFVSMPDVTTFEFKVAIEDRLMESVLDVYQSLLVSAPNLEKVIIEFLGKYVGDIETMSSAIASDLQILRRISQFFGQSYHITLKLDIRFYSGYSEYWSEYFYGAGKSVYQLKCATLLDEKQLVEFDNNITVVFLGDL
ncbi:unnamed protein product [Bursaphelenchus okinawaensis]|uniref:Uncharacterized protein n=1 Tax=Bursaphelenchus okinawaensis TaxID=465554 RepID=A0A811KFH5_9BILA|nr:unnamed protein product [Bursaphelenchus okinawaensis]CAG9102094.1 unnamed protein product [Bursaphelenchus okinawaensis]